MGYGVWVAGMGYRGMGVWGRGHGGWGRRAFVACRVYRQRFRLVGGGVVVAFAVVIGMV